MFKREIRRQGFKRDTIERRKDLERLRIEKDESTEVLSSGFLYSSKNRVKNKNVPNRFMSEGNGKT